LAALENAWFASGQGLPIAAAAASPGLPIRAFAQFAIVTDQPTTRGGEYKGVVRVVFLGLVFVPSEERLSHRSSESAQPCGGWSANAGLNFRAENGNVVIGDFCAVGVLG
jgi:hypothetical protein